MIIALVLALAAVLAGPGLYEMCMKIIYPRSFSQLVEGKAEEFQLDENLIYAVIKTESGFDENAQSHANAKGLMQLTDQTFEWIASMYPPESHSPDIFDPADNIHCGSALLRLLINQYGSLDVALAAYNAGMGNVAGWLENDKYSSDGESLHTIPYPETEAYVKKVKKAMETYDKLYGSEAN